MKLKKLIVAFSAAFFAIGLMVAQSSNVQAAKSKYKTSTEVRAVKYGKKTAMIKYKKIVIKGKSKKAKKINKKLNSIAKAHYNGLKDGAKYVLPSEGIDGSMNMKVTTNNKKYICVKVIDYSYIGGAHGYTSEIGYTFNSKGKLLKLNKVFKKSQSYVTKKLLKAFAKWKKSGHTAYEDSEKLIKKSKTKDLDYYIQGKKIYVCFQPYAVAPYSEGIVKLRLK